MQPRETPILLGPETETPRGWSYRVTLHRSPDRASTHTVTLSWADHDQLSAGLVPPSRTVEAALAVVLRHGEGIDRLPSTFDIATLRRMIAGFDDLVRERS
jgi:hypothetical protein